MGDSTMSKDDQVVDNPTDHLEEEYLRTADANMIDSDLSDIAEESTADSKPNLDDIRSAGL